MQSLWAVAALLAGAAATTPASEVAALREFYGALGGDGWLDNHLWNSASDPCDGNDPWYGVFCEINASLPNATHVVGIALGYNQLDGTLPASLANLPRLRTLDLESNQAAVPARARFSSSAQFSRSALSIARITSLTSPQAVGISRLAFQPPVAGWSL